MKLKNEGIVDYLCCRRCFTDKPRTMFSGMYHGDKNYRICKACVEARKIQKIKSTPFDENLAREYDNLGMFFFAEVWRKTGYISFFIYSGQKRHIDKRVIERYLWGDIMDFRVSKMSRDEFYDTMSTDRLVDCCSTGVFSYDRIVEYLKSVK